MTCDIVPTSEVNPKGKRRYRCSREGCWMNSGRGLWVADGKKIHPGSCSAWPHPHELGHWLTLLLEACWIRKRDYLWLKAKLGLAPKCGCDKRVTWLNHLGHYLTRRR